ncbi:MAG TPA: ATP-binding protein [Gammaproteobacteria bacterium]|nr:ATP-binding protein [Gammaproteobacteria bacterium]
MLKWRFNLFWRIFLWLWLTLVLFIGVHLILMSYEQNEMHIEPVSEDQLRVLRRFAEHYGNLPLPPPMRQPPTQAPPGPSFKSGPEDQTRQKPGRQFEFELFLGEDADAGKRGFAWSAPGAHHRPRPQLNLSFLDEQGKETRDKPLDQTLVRLHSRYLAERVPHLAYWRQNFYMGPILIQQDGMTRYVYMTRRLPSLGEEHLRIIWNRAPKSFLLSAVLITFPVCFALAWYLSSPIRRLQRATHEFSKHQEAPAQIKPLLRRNDEFGDLARDFNQMAIRVQRTLESHKRLLSDVSHELRSPLARLRIAIGLAEQKEAGHGTANGGRKELDQMILECGRIDSLIGQLLDIARLDNAASNPETADFDLCALVLEIKENAEIEAGQKKVRLCAALPAKRHMRGSPDMLRSAVENVLRNAIRHTPPDSEIAIDLSVEGKSLLLTVRDQGSGVEEIHLDKIFEPFYRPQYARERGSGGAGLGLAIAKRAVAHHGGEIWAQNASGGGLQVSIRLPLQPDPGSA